MQIQRLTSGKRQIVKCDAIHERRSNFGVFSRLFFIEFVEKNYGYQRKSRFDFVEEKGSFLTKS